MRVVINLLIWSTFGEYTLSTGVSLKDHIRDTFDVGFAPSEDTRPDLTEFSIRCLKQSSGHPAGIPEYQRAVIHLMEEDPVARQKLVETYSRYIHGDDISDVLRGINFASRFNASEGVLLKQLNELLADRDFAFQLGRIQAFYSYQRTVDRFLAEASKAFKRNSEGNTVRNDLCARFCLLLFELEQLSSDNTINASLLRVVLTNALLTGEPIDLVHMKCLRYVYPNGKLRIGKDMGYLEIQTKSGEVHIPKQESDLFDRLKKIKELFAYYGVNSVVHILVADYELDAFKRVIPLEEVDVNCTRLVKYMDALSRGVAESGINANLVLISELLDAKYHVLKKSIGNRLAGGLGVKSLSSNAFEQIVDRTYERYGDLLVDRPTRQTAREFAIDLTSGILAMQYVYETLFDGKGILIEDSRGNENYYTGTGSDGRKPFSIFFTNLRE